MQNRRGVLTSIRRKMMRARRKIWVVQNNLRRKMVRGARYEGCRPT